MAALFTSCSCLTTGLYSPQPLVAKVISALIGSRLGPTTAKPMKRRHSQLDSRIGIKCILHVVTSSEHYAVILPAPEEDDRETTKVLLRLCHFVK